MRQCAGGVDWSFWKTQVGGEASAHAGGGVAALGLVALSNVVVISAFLGTRRRAPLSRRSGSDWTGGDGGGMGIGVCREPWIWNFGRGDKREGGGGGYKRGRLRGFGTVFD